MRVDNPAARARRLVAEQPAESAGAVGPVAGLRRLCLAAVQDVPALGVGISVMTEAGVRVMAAASDARTGRIDQLQFTLGEGPCMDAFSERRPVLEADVEGSGTRQWPAYGPAACAEGARAVFAFPMQVGAARLGVLDLHRGVPGSLSRQELAVAAAFSEVAIEILLDAQEPASANGASGRLKKASGLGLGLGLGLGDHTVVHQAQGMLMVQLGVTLVEALALLRAYAYSHERDLRDVGHDVVAEGLRLDHDDGRL